MLSVEQAALRALLAAVEGGAPPDSAAPGGAGAVGAAGLLADAELVALGRHHRLSPLLGGGRPALALPPAVAAAFRADRLASLGRTTLLRHALVELLGALEARAVEAAVLKGIAYEERLYAGEPGARPAADVDLLVRPRARGAAFAALAALGYRAAAGAPGYDQPDYHEVTFRRGAGGGAIVVDLHFALAPPRRCRIDHEALWAAMQPLSVDGFAARTLGDAHAAANQALHMAIHHFDVPALYLVDLARLGDRVAGGRGAVDDVARAWRCRRPLETALALAAAFLPPGRVAAAPPSARARRIVRDFGGRSPLPRAQQLRRKVEHFDEAADAIRYLALQARRFARERLLALAPRTPAERLGIVDGGTEARGEDGAGP